MSASGTPQGDQRNDGRRRSGERDARALDTHRGGHARGRVSAPTAGVVPQRQQDWRTRSGGDCQTASRTSLFADEDSENTFVLWSFRAKPRSRHVIDENMRAQKREGKVAHLSLRAITEGDPHWGMPDTAGRLPGVTLREMRAELGGEDGLLSD